MHSVAMSVLDVTAHQLQAFHAHAQFSSSSTPAAILLVSCSAAAVCTPRPHVPYDYTASCTLQPLSVLPAVAV